MKTHAVIPLILLSLVCGGTGGYVLRAQKSEGSVVLSVKDVVQAEYLAPPDSFSRIANTRNALDALGARLRLGVVDAVVTYKRLPQNSDPERRTAKEVLERAIRAAEAGMEEFEGTEQQLDVAQGLLFALQEAGRFDRWTEVYLKALYEHPTHPLVARLASEAIRISERAGREERVLEALSHLYSFQPAFAGKSQIEAALSSAHPCFSQVTISDSAASVVGM